MQAPVVPAGATVLVTGAAGMLGRAVAARLAQAGCHSRLLVRRAAQAAQLPASAEVIVGDVGDAGMLQSALQGVSAVLHLAATTRGSRADFDATNIDATRRLIEACLGRPARLVHVSSIGVLDHAGRSATSGPLREDAPLEPFPEQRGNYTRTKLAAETLVREAAMRGLDAVILRPGQILGPGSERVTPNGVVALRGWNLVGDGRSPLPLVFVEDVVDALLLAAFRPGIAGEVFHIVDPVAVSQDEYLSRWRARVTDVPLRRVPWMLALGAAWCIEMPCRLLGREAPLTRYRVKSLRPLSGFDVDKAARLLGWQPRVGVRAGLDRTFGEAGRVP
jgi:nucleoside-diphosphate-sugar epimerase